MSTYLKNVKDNAIFESTLPVYVQLVRTESIAPYRFAIGSFFFATADEYKERMQDARKNSEKDEAKKRLDLMRKYAEQIVAEEKEKSNTKQYRDAMKRIF
jgi:hypothetical protein